MINRLVQEVKSDKECTYATSMIESKTCSGYILVLQNGSADIHFTISKQGWYRYLKATLSYVSAKEINHASAW